MAVALQIPIGMPEERTALLCPLLDSFSARVHRAREEAHRKLASFRNLGEGWDGYHAKPISSEAIGLAEFWIDRFPAMPEVFPTSDGNVQFQFEDSDDNYLELELRQDDTAEFYADMGNTEPEERVVDMKDSAEWSCLLRLVSIFA